MEYLTLYSISVMYKKQQYYSMIYLKCSIAELCDLQHNITSQWWLLLDSDWSSQWSFIVILAVYRDTVHGELSNIYPEPWC